MNHLHKYLILISVVLGLHPAVSAQTVSVTFRVNMSYQIELDNFDPATEFVDVAGSFNGWGSTLTKLFDSDSNKIYEVTVAGFVPSSTIEYKFRFNGQWDGREEFPGTGNNRTFTVQSDSNLISVWYNDEVSPTGPPSADFSTSTQTLYENGIVYFEDRSSGSIDGWEWTFEGGSPGTSDQRDPVIIYPDSGTFGVTLVVSNTTESDTLVIPRFIQVLERDVSATFWWNNTVFYELFVRSFYDSDGDGIGDFNGIIQKLDYLNDGDPNTDSDLGITGIWLMPINQSPSYHGYDVIDYRSVNSDYGTMDDFKDFLSEAHSRGIRVIMDFVMNHSSNQHPWFEQAAQNDERYRSFYRWSDSKPEYRGPWGQEVWHFNATGYYYGLFWSGMPDLNYEHPAVKDSMFAVADFWLNDIGLDGFRLDAVKYIFEEGSNLEDTQSTFQFWSNFNQHIKQVKPDAFAVGEAWTNTETILKYVTDDRLDYCFEFNLASATLNAVSSGEAGDLSAQMQKVHNLYPHLQYGTFLTNHDQSRVMHEFQQDLGKAKVAAALYLTFPGIPYIYYGEEIGMVGAKPDEFIRTPMQWSDEPNAGFTSGSPWIRVNNNYPTYNVLVEQEDPESLLNWYKQLIAIRNQEPALRLGDYKSIISSASSVMAFLRHYQDESIMVVVNTSPSDRHDLTLSLLGGVVQPGPYILKNRLVSSDSLSVSVNSSGEIEDLAVNGFGTLIYSFSKGSITGIEGRTSTIDDFHLHQNFPNPFNPTTRIAYSISKSGIVTLKVYDVLGREITTVIDEFQNAGTYSVNLNAKNLPSGVYFYRLQFGSNLVKTKKMLLMH